MGPVDGMVVVVTRTARIPSPHPAGGGARTAYFGMDEHT